MHDLAVVLISVAATLGHPGTSLADSPTGPTAIPLGAVPAPVVAFCDQRARRHAFTVLCPTRYPRTRQSQVTLTGRSLLGPSFYWASFNDAAGFDGDDEGHLLLGGQRLPFSLAGSQGQTWPRPGQPRPVKQLPLPRLITVAKDGGGSYVSQRPARVLGRAAVNGRKALVLVAPAYPEGGLMGGHVIVLWNRLQHGYMLSLHFSAGPGGRPFSLAQRVSAALKIAATFAPVS